MRARAAAAIQHRIDVRARSLRIYRPATRQIEVPGGAPTPPPAGGLAGLTTSGHLPILAEMRGPTLALSSLAACVLLASIAEAQRILGTIRGGAALDGFGAVVAALSDVDGDGTGDYAVSAQRPCAPYVEIRSGRDHRLLSMFTGPCGSGFGVALAGIGDVTGDGVPDLAVGSPWAGRVDIYAGTSGVIFASLLDSPTSQLGWALLGVDDVDGDGVPDFVAAAPGAGQARLYSGRNRAWIRAFNLGNLGMFEDINRDGVREILGGSLGGGGTVHVVDLRTGTILRSVSGSSPYHGSALERVGDVDLDGVPDFAVGDPQVRVVYLYSGRTGSLLRAINGPHGVPYFGCALGHLGDINGDGVPDLAVGGAAFLSQFSSVPGFLAFVSGATGSIIMRMDSQDPGAQFGRACAGLADIDGDGMRDVLVGAPGEDHLSADQGVVRVISGRIVAQAIQVGAGCGGGPFVPLLGATRPIVGTTGLLVGEWSPPAPGFLLLSQPPVIPTNLGVPQCNAYVDLATTMVLAQIPPGTGRWTLPLPVPSIPGLPGLELSFQALYGATAGPLGFDLTNGLRWRVGW